MAVELVTPPAVEAILLDEAKRFARIETTADDLLVEALIRAARQRIEGPQSIYRLALITQTWDWWAPEFPATEPYDMRFPIWPVQEVLSVDYTDPTGIVQPLDPSGYQLDLKSDPARILPAYGGTWPAIQPIVNPIAIRFVAGFGDDGAAVPQTIIQAMLLAIAYWYENRDAIGAELPYAIDAIIGPYRRYFV